MNIEKARADKDSIQKVRLALNQITPDNLDRKISELREMLIGTRKLLTEEGFRQEDAEGFSINEDILSIVVQTIFRKAQVEQGKKAVPINLKYCAFRKKLLDYCREVYEQIFANTDYEALKKKAEEEGKTYTTDDHRYV